MTEIDIRKGSYESAETHLVVLEKEIAASFPSLFLRGRLEYERPNGDLSVAKKALANVLKLPTNTIRQADRALTLELKAKIFRREVKVDDAIDALSQAARLDNRNAALF